MTLLSWPEGIFFAEGDEDLAVAHGGEETAEVALGGEFRLVEDAFADGVGL